MVASPGAVRMFYETRVKTVNRIRNKLTPLRERRKIIGGKTSRLMRKLRGIK